MVAPAQGFFGGTFFAGAAAAGFLAGATAAFFGGDAGAFFTTFLAGAAATWPSIRTSSTRATT